MYLVGKIKDILDIQIFKNNFKKKSLILLTDEQYPQNILIDFIQDKIDLLNFININDKVKVFINIKGRKWINKEGVIKYFNSIQGWKIEKIKNENLFEINSNYIKNNKFNDYDNNYNIDENYNNNDEDNNDDEDIKYDKKKKKKKKF
ncbi:MAG: DUF3127 domain-containing protein [Candidatus Shikimatogenerans bostrichidophilus]|nr:MAG: DUF3127 domain-containing protein [Candidatus Shikimatogenerans bostrichidophilus]